MTRGMSSLKFISLEESLIQLKSYADRRRQYGRQSLLPVLHGNYLSHGVPRATANLAQDGLADLATNLPDSNGELRPDQHSEEDPFDVDVLIQKLEAYKASVEHAKDQLRRKRSINPRDVSEATAAARLKLRLDGRPAASSESHDNSVLNSPVTLAFPSSVSSHGSSASETSYFDPITPEWQDDGSVAMVTSRNNNRDTWKSSHSVVSPSEKVKTYDTSTRLSEPRHNLGRRVQEVQTSKPLPHIKVLGCRSKVSSPLASPSFSASDWLSMPSAVGSLAMSESGEVPRESTEKMSMCPPNEDRIRREIETFTIKAWEETEDIKQLEAIVSAKEPSQVQIEPLSGSDDEDHSQSGTAEKVIQPLEKYKYGRLTFREKVGGLWNRRTRTKTDKIISLYFDMETSPKQQAWRT